TNAFRVSDVRPPSRTKDLRRRPALRPPPPRSEAPSLLSPQPSTGRQRSLRKPAEAMPLQCRVHKRPAPTSTSNLHQKKAEDVPSPVRSYIAQRLQAVL